MIIGLTGKKGSGKDTVADMIGLPKFALANPLKYACATLFNDPIQNWYDPDVKELEVVPGITRREFMQRFGTEFVRKWYPGLWVQLLERQRKPKSYVVSDIRFEDEAAWVRSKGGVIWHIVRTPIVYDSHPSEAGIDVKSGDVIISNNGTLEELRSVVNDTLAS